MHLSSFQRHRRMGSGASCENELDAHPHQGAWVAAGRPRLDADHLPDRPGPLPQATAALGHRGRTGKFTMLPRRLPPPQAENPGNRGDGSELVESSWVHGGRGQATRERRPRDRGAVELRPADSDRAKRGRRFASPLGELSLDPGTQVCEPIDLSVNRPRPGRRSAHGGSTRPRRSGSTGPSPTSPRKGSSG